MTEKTKSDISFSMPLAMFLPSLVAIVVLFISYREPIRRFARESLMQRVSSAHYEVLYPSGALPQGAITEFESQREPLFAALGKKIGYVDSKKKVRIVFDLDFTGPSAGVTSWQFYSVTGTTIRTKLNGQTLRLPSRADAEALLYISWGKPGNAQLGQWTAIWLAGEWNGAEIGMAAAQVEQRIGHQKLANVLENAGENLSPNDQTLLGAAWISEIADFGGPGAVRKLYAARMSRFTVAGVAQAMGTAPLELDRKWQMWMYSYLAGMPPMPPSSQIPMDMPMAGNH